MELRRAGFHITRTDVADVEKILGLEPEGARLQVPLRKLGDLDAALQLVYEAEAVNPLAAATVLGVFTWFALIWRPALSSVQTLYRYAERSRDCVSAPAW